MSAVFPSSRQSSGRDPSGSMAATVLPLSHCRRPCSPSPSPAGLRPCSPRGEHRKARFSPRAPLSRPLRSAMGRCLPSRPRPSVCRQRQRASRKWWKSQRTRWPLSYVNRRPQAPTPAHALRLAAFRFALVAALLLAGIRLRRRVRAQPVLYHRRGHTRRPRYTPPVQPCATVARAATPAAVARRRGPLPAPGRGDGSTREGPAPLWSFPRGAQGHSPASGIAQSLAAIANTMTLLRTRA